MRILQIVSGRGRNGAVHHCLWLTRQLLARGHQVSLLCRPGAWIGKQLETEGLQAVLQSDLSRWPPTQLRRIAAELKRRGIQVMHTHMSDAHAFGVLLRLLTRTGCVATAHNTYIQLHWPLNDRVIAVSDAVRRFHCRYNLVAKRRRVTIHNFIDHQRLTQIDRSLAAPAAHQSEPLLGYVGSIEPRKGLIYLVQALARVPGCRLLVVGSERVDVAYAQRVRRLAEHLGVACRIQWYGPAGDVPALLSGMNLVVIPSLQEPGSIVMLEAMASGLAVVATRRGGPAEVLLDGQDGLLVPPADAAGLAEALGRLVASPERCRELGRRAAERVRREFTVEQKVPQIEAVLAAACGENPSHCH